MFGKTISLVAGLVCLIGILQGAGAFELTPRGSLHGELISFAINQCPDLLGDACHFNYSKPFEFDITFRAGIAFSRVSVGVHYSNIDWITNYRDEGYASADWSTIDGCNSSVSFCPGNIGDVRTYHGKLALEGTDGVWRTPGRFQMHLRSLPDLSAMVGFSFPAVGFN